MASALAVIDEKRQLIATETGLFIRDRQTGHTTMHQPIEADNPATRSNDARVHPAGAFWVGTMGKTQKGAGSIYWYRQGELRKLFSDISITNSICFSPDGRISYFADTGKNIIWRVDTDPETGLPIGEPVVVLPAQGKGRCRWIRGRCRWKFVERMLGRLMHQCLFANRKAYPLYRNASPSTLLPGVCQRRQRQSHRDNGLSRNE